MQIMLNDLKNPRVAIIAGALLLSGLLIGCGAAYVRSNKHDQVISLRERLTELKQKDAQLKAKIQTLSSLERRVDSFHERVPPDPGVGRLLEELGLELTNGQATGLSTKIDQERVEHGVGRVAFELAFAAPFDTINALLLHLAKHPRILHVDRVEINGPATEAEQAMAVRLVVSAFFDAGVSEAKP